MASEGKPIMSYRDEVIAESATMCMASECAEARVSTRRGFPNLVVHRVDGGVVHVIAHTGVDHLHELAACNIRTMDGERPTPEEPMRCADCGDAPVTKTSGLEILRGTRA
jgi:hypothetical protein